MRRDCLSILPHGCVCKPLPWLSAGSTRCLIPLPHLWPLPLLLRCCHPVALKHSSKHSVQPGHSSLDNPGEEMEKLGCWRDADAPCRSAHGTQIALVGATEPMPACRITSGYIYNSGISAVGTGRRCRVAVGHRRPGIWTPLVLTYSCTAASAQRGRKHQPARFNWAPAMPPRQRTRDSGDALGSPPMPHTTDISDLPSDLLVRCLETLKQQER